MFARAGSEGLKNVEQICSLMESLFPIAVVAAVDVGLIGSGLVILQSFKEAAFLRILGVRKKCARCMLALEQILLCVTGIIFVVCGLAVYSPELFARSLASKAKVILADEPTGNLDSANTQNIIEILVSLAHEKGYCVVIVTHDSEIAESADVALRMRDGELRLV